MDHLNLDAIWKLTSKDMVCGLSVLTLHEFDTLCEGCAFGKSQQLPFPKVSATEYPKMGLVIVDLTGPMSVETWSGKHYALIVVEASCRYGTGTLLTSKDEVYNALITIITQLEWQSNEKCCIL